jgi:hypothetical protein
MNHSTKIPEKFIYEIWKNENLSKKLSTEDGKELEILFRGEENLEFGGPDFKNARVKISGITYVGDVEIDCFHSDWKNHGHNLNKRFNSVILHAVLNNENNQQYVFTKEGRKVQTICIGALLNESLRESIKKAILSEREKRMSRFPCEELNHMVAEKEKLDFLFDLGMHRFRKKIEKIYTRLKEIKFVHDLKVSEPVVKYELPQSFYKTSYSAVDLQDKELWEQLFYELLFEALGYSKNQNIMTDLSKSVNLKFLRLFKNYDNFLGVIETSLFSVSGLVQQEKNPYADDAYFKEYNGLWEHIKRIYDGEFYDNTQWHFMKTRPQNFPTLRIAGGARLVNRILKEHLIEKIMNTFANVKNEKVILNSVKSMIIVKGEGFWSRHYNFENSGDIDIKYFVGASRADEIIVNVVLPFMLLYFETFDKKEAAEKTLRMYSEFIQISENNLVKEMSDLLHVKDAWKRSILYQGMIDLFRSYCSKNNCLQCKIGNEIFN